MRYVLNTVMAFLMSLMNIRDNIFIVNDVKIYFISTLCNISPFLRPSIFACIKLLSFACLPLKVVNIDSGSHSKA